MQALLLVMSESSTLSMSAPLVYRLFVLFVSTFLILKLFALLSSFASLMLKPVTPFLFTLPVPKFFTPLLRFATLSTFFYLSASACLMSELSTHLSTSAVFFLSISPSTSTVLSASTISSISAFPFTSAFYMPKPLILSVFAQSIFTLLIFGLSALFMLRLSLISISYTALVLVLSLPLFLI